MREHIEGDMEPRQQHFSGDERVFDMFVRDHARPVLAYCLRRSTHIDAHEAASDVFFIAWRKFGEVPDGEAGLYWLFGVARRVLSNQQRGRKRRQRMTDRLRSLGEDQVPSAETVVLRSAYDQEVIDALALLRPRDQELVALIVWDDIPREEVSNLLEISVAAVNKRYQRALRRLEDALSSGDEYGNTTHPIAEEGGAA